MEKIEFEFYYNSTYLIIEASSAEPATRLGILPECASGAGEPTWSGKTKARKSWMNRRSCRCSTSMQSHRINTGGQAGIVVGLKIEGKQVMMELDTGASVSIMAETTWKKTFGKLAKNLRHV